LTAFGLLFGLCGLAVPNDPGALITMALGGAVFAIIGYSMARGRIELGRQELICHAFPRTQRIARSEIRNILVVEGIWNYGGIPQDSIVVEPSGSGATWDGTFTSEIGWCSARCSASTPHRAPLR